MTAHLHRTQQQCMCKAAEFMKHDKSLIRMGVETCILLPSLRGDVVNFGCKPYNSLGWEIPGITRIISVKIKIGYQNGHCS